MSDRQQKVSRRQMVAGAGTIGALAAAASVLPLSKEQAAEAVAAKPAPAQGGGYRESEHVKRYYQTTRI